MLCTAWWSWNMEFLPFECIRISQNWNVSAALEQWRLEQVQSKCIMGCQEIQCSTWDSHSRLTPCLTFDILFWVGGKRGAGVPGYGVPGCGKHGVWKTRDVENTGSGGKHGVWKTHWWKTGDLNRKHGVKVKNTGEPLFRPTMNFHHQPSDEKSKFCYFKLQLKSFGAKRVFKTSGYAKRRNEFFAGTSRCKCVAHSLRCRRCS